MKSLTLHKMFLNFEFVFVVERITREYSGDVIRSKWTLQTMLHYNREQCAGSTKRTLKELIGE